jgi:MATE family multidrug resistance protein
VTDTEKDMEQTLLPKGREDKKPETPISLTWGVFTVELKRLSVLAGPMVAVILSQNMLQVISIMMVGHLDELALSSTAIAISLSTVTGFSFLVSRLHIYIYIYIYIYDPHFLFIFYFPVIVVFNNTVVSVS